MAQSLLGLRVLHSYGAGGRGFLGDRLSGYGCSYWRSCPCCLPPTGVAGASSLAAAAVLYLFHRVRLGADPYPATLAPFLLQLSLRDGDAACTRSTFPP